MSKMPWEMSPEEVRKASGEAALPAEAKEVKSDKKPWEMALDEIRAFFKPKPSAPIPTAPKAPVEAPMPLQGAVPTEASMKTAASDLFTPAANAKRKAQEQAPANIKELQEEINKTKDPAKKKILMEYMGSLNKGTTSQKEIGAGSDKGDVKLKTLLDNASDNSDFKTLYSFLKDKDSLPDMKVDPSLSSRGEFTYGDGQPSQGVLSVGGSSQGFVSTLVHEMTHAADRQMIQLSLDIEKAIRKGEKISKDEEQFLSNWKKSFGARSVGEGGGEAIGMKSLMKSIADPKWLSENQDYRATRAESIAHGVGNVNKKSSEIYNLQTHMDPSIATEFMILLQQAKKIMKKGK